VHPTILVDVPEEADAVREETFGPTLTISRVTDAEEALHRANAVRYGLGGAVFGRRRAAEIAGRMRSGMTAINSTLTFVGMPTLPFGGIGDSGFGRIHGADGLREFARSKAVTRRRGPSLLPAMTFERTPAQVERIVKAAKILYGR
jgi:acyl-CoA reductase-like NAD-dependent aldehyde dehydrogenase